MIFLKFEPTRYPYPIIVELNQRAVEGIFNPITNVPFIRHYAIKPIFSEEADEWCISNLRFPPTFWNASFEEIKIVAGFLNADDALIFKLRFC